MSKKPHFALLLAVTMLAGVIRTPAAAIAAAENRPLAAQASGDDAASAPQGDRPDFQLPDNVPAWVKTVVDEPTFQRFIGPVEIATSFDVYDRLLSNLILSSDLSRALDIGEYWVTDEDGDTVVDDGKGAKAALNQVHQSEGLRIFAGQGAFELPLLPDATGKGVIEVRYFMQDGVLVSQARLSFLVDGHVYPHLTRMALQLLQDQVDARLFTFVHCANELSERIARDAYAFAKRLPSPKLLIAFRKVFRADIKRALKARRTSAGS